ncbi:MAG TPA: mechanosensitive ion channel family protein [Pirellulales bacterium]|nr:mechanosensitive ion channel family protein [Pirellulales bacterium]
MRYAIQRGMIIGVLLGAATAAHAQSTAPPAKTTAPQAPQKVDVEPVARDDQIAKRLSRILKATGWFRNPDVKVDAGVVFVDGQTSSEDYKKWAESLAEKTEDVVAVVNHIQVEEPPMFDVRPAMSQIRSLVKEAVRSSPLLVIGLLVLVITWFAAKLTRRLSEAVLQRRLRNALIIEVASRTLAIPVFLCGLYVVMEVSGLSRLALTIVGGTGLAGLVLGIAFRDILENFLASILISLQNPFRTGDLIDVEGKLGFVQRVTTRGTILMAFDGTYIQIPNSTVYKSTIHNLTANPKMRQEFTVRIGYLDPVNVAQEAAVQVLRDHPAILKDPEPMVLVDDLDAASVNLRVYFWVDARQYSDLKVRSSAMRLVKSALQEAKMLSPDGIQQVAFPKGITVQEADDQRQRGRVQTKPVAPAPSEPCRNETCETVTEAEGGLKSDRQELHEQAAEAPLPSQGENLLAASASNGDHRS